MQNQIIVFENNKPIISNEFKENYQKFLELKEKIEEAQDIIKKEMIKYYESLDEEDRKTLNFGSFKMSYVKSSIRKTLDSKKLQDEEPEIYNKFLKETPVKSTIKFM